jgi:glycosyltransferase involved in cell wall biosynthesis
MEGLAPTHPKVSVVIPAYNCGPYLPCAIDSVLSQTYRSFEVIVVNDGSTDGTEKVLLPYRDRIKYLAGQNRGASAARNKGFAASRGDLIAYLDADDVWRPEKLALQVELFEANPDVGVCFTDFTFLGERLSGNRGFTERDSALLRYPSRQIGSRSYLLTSLLLLQDFLVHQAFPKPSVTMIRRECLDRIGGFDESLQICEDTQMYLRLAKYFKFAYVDEPLVQRRVRDDTLASSADSRRYAAVHIQMIENLEKWIPLSAKETSISNKLLSSYRFSAGYTEFSDGHLRASRHHLRRSLKTHASLRALLYFVMTFFPPEWIRTLRQFKRQPAR